MLQFDKSLLLPVLVIFCICNNQPVGAQEQEEKKFRSHHQIGLMLGHAQVIEGRNAEGEKAVLSMPSWSVDYNFHISPKWAIGLHTDIIVEKFEVADEEDEISERSYPIAPALMGIFKATEHWTLLLGMGGEFAKEENFVLTRAGVEYGVEIGERGWEVFGAVCYDFKWNAYDTWSIGIGISKSFRRKK